MDAVKRGLRAKTLRGGGPAPQTGAPGGGAGLSGRWTPATQMPAPSTGADSRSACLPVDSPPTETTEDHEWGSNGLTEEEIRYSNARFLEVLGCGPGIPTEKARSRAPSEATGPEPALTEPPPPEDPSRASVGRGSDAIDGPEANDRGPRPAPNGTYRPMPSARRLAGAVLALLALIGAAGLPAASEPSHIEPTSASPGGPIGRILARGSNRGPTWACWRCSSRVPDRAVVIPREWRG